MAKIDSFVAEYVRIEDLDGAMAFAGIAPLELPLNGYYTYLLVDPRFNSIFYVGKGKGRRAFRHEADVLAHGPRGLRKDARIVEMHSEGHKVRVVVFSIHDNQSDAFRAESLLIDGLRDCGITNIVGVVTDRNQLQFERASAMLRRIKPYERWVATAGNSVLEWSSRNYGSPLKLYEKFVRECERLTREPMLRELASGRPICCGDPR